MGPEDYGLNCRKIFLQQDDLLDIMLFATSSATKQSSSITVKTYIAIRLDNQRQ